MKIKLWAVLLAIVIVFELPIFLISYPTLITGGGGVTDAQINAASGLMFVGIILMLITCFVYKANDWGKP